MTESEIFQAGMKYAAMLVRAHWNDSLHMTNQKQQAERSANAIEHHANATDNIKSILKNRKDSKTNG